MSLSRSWCLSVALIAALTWQCPQLASGYRPVIIMHGIFASYSDMDDLVGFIKDAHPGTEIYNVDAYNGDLLSLEKMWNQVKGVHDKVQHVFDKATDGVNMICYSQGGLICRAILEVYSENIHTFISLSSPLAGQYGDTEYLKDLFPNFTKEHLYLVFYTRDGQDISIANYWNDPHHQSLYREYCDFLSSLNNGSNPDYKTNFLNLQQLVLIGGPDDGVITPWQSSHFAFYDENDKVLPMTSQEFYIKDSFGLRTLNESGKVKVYEIPGVQHVHWHGTKSVFDCCIEPWLK